MLTCQMHKKVADDQQSALLFSLHHLPADSLEEDVVAFSAVFDTSQ